MTKPTIFNSDGPLKGHTPVMQQYLDIKSLYPEELLFFRIGDFYELFYEDAKTASSLLDLTLTSRHEHNLQPIPMAGVPHHTLEQCLVKLLRLGRSAVICEQVGDAVANGPMRREVSRIVTPGTLTDVALLDEKQNSLLLAIWLTSDEKTCGLAWLNLAAGELRMLRIPTTQLPSQLERLRPAEILIAEEMRLPLPNGNWAIKKLPMWHFDAKKSERDLSQHLKVKDLAVFAAPAESLAATSALWHYAQATQRRQLTHITTLLYEKEDEFIHMDAVTRRNLEISETLRNTPAPTLMSVFDCCVTSMGSRFLRHTLHHPTRNQARAGLRHDAVDELLEASLWSTIHQSLKGSSDLERITTRLALKSVRPKELARLRDTLELLPALSALLSNCQGSLLRELHTGIQVPEECVSLLRRAILPDPATWLREGVVLCDDYDGELSRLRSLHANYGQSVVDIERKERSKTGIPNLKVSFNRVHGFYIEISHSHAHKTPEEYQRRQTLKNAERYTTPELKDLEHSILHAEEKAKALEKRLFDELLNHLQIFVPALRTAATALSQLDVLCAFACTAKRFNYCRPTWAETPVLDIEQGRHAVVEQQLDRFISNDTHLTSTKPMVVITGPNMGGKSTYMRQNALIVLLAYCGSFVPANAARIGPVDALFTRIGASDDLASGRSTFMVEMTEAAAIIHQAGPNSVILMDEVGRGTSAFEGMALATAIAHQLLYHNGSLTFFATHYFEITQLAMESERCSNMHVRAVQHGEGIVFLYALEEGPANQSYALEVASLAGMPKSVVADARRQLQKIENLTASTHNLQPDFFAGAPHPAISALKNLDPDKMAPKAALAALYHLKDLLG